ncbi:cyclosome subunit-like protein, putative, partial [Bodo saltans]
MSIDSSLAVEVSRSDGNLWSTVVVRRGQHLMFSASHRDVLSALLVNIDGTICVWVFHGDSLQDAKGRFFLGYKPTLCTSYNISTTQYTTAALHPTIPHHVARGVRGVYIFGQRTLAMKHQLQIAARSLCGRPLVPACDAWWMGIGMSLCPILIPQPLSDDLFGDERQRRPPVPLEARLIKEWNTQGAQYCLALTKDNKLRIATTEFLVSASSIVLKWEWLSNPVPFPLSCEGAVTTTIADHSESFSRQVLFVFSEYSQKVAVYRTSPLHLTAACDVTMELIALLPTSCAAFPLEIYPSFGDASSPTPNVLAQPIAVVRGWCIELFCPYTISHSSNFANDKKYRSENPTNGEDPLREVDGLHPFATLHFSTVDLQDGIMDVLSVSRCSIRALSSSMEVRVIDVPHLHILSHPVLKHVFSMLPSLHPLLPLSRTYELLQWLIASLWYVTGDLELSSDWTTWNAFTERLKCVFVYSLATDQGFDNL